MPSSFGGRALRSGGVAVAGLAVLAAGCDLHPRVPFGTPTQAEWTLARERLTKLREAQPTKPYAEVVRVAMHEPKTGKTFEARGAVAVDPHKAIRMILVGPGGATALDAWATADRFRLAVPALDLVRRGTVADGALPIGFFRWWFLHPFDGRLLTARAKPASTLFVLRQGTATITILEETAGAQAGLATRRDGKALDRLAWVGKDLGPGEGDRALYQQPSTGLQVMVDVESIATDPPDPAAFVDPDPSGAGR